MLPGFLKQELDGGKKLSLVSLTYVSENNKKNLKLEKLNGISSLEIVESTKDV